MTPAEERAQVRRAEAQERLSVIKSQLHPSTKRRASALGAELTEEESMARAREITAEWNAANPSKVIAS